MYNNIVIKEVGGLIIHYFVKKFKVDSTVERSSLFDSPRTLCIVHVYTKQLFVGVHYLELIDCTCSLRSLGVASITLCVYVLWCFCIHTRKRLTKDENYWTTALLHLKRNRMI